MEQKGQPHERIILHVCRVHHSVHYFLSQLSLLHTVPVWQGLMTRPVLSQRAFAFLEELDTVNSLIYVSMLHLHSVTLC